MKQKSVYLILIVCCFSLFSAAKQSGSRCDKKARIVCEPVEEEVPIQINRLQPGAADLSPVQFLLFSI